MWLQRQPGFLRRGALPGRHRPGRAFRRRRAAAVVTSVTAACTLVPLAVPAADAATVTVQRGQNLTEIAAWLHTTVAALMAANHLTDPDYVQAGAVLQVPGSGAARSTAAQAGSVVIGTGDTLTAIASRYGTTVADLVALNSLADPNHIQAGARLRLPAAGSSGVGTGAMALASYQVAVGGLPAQLAAHPERLVLRPDFASAASQYGVPLALLEALCWWESGWQASIVSSTGAVGVCQIEPATATFVDQVLVHSVLDPHVPAQNIDIGAAYLASLLRATGGNTDQAVAGYYQGLGSVRASGMFRSTATYVRGIEAYAVIFGS